MEQDTVNCLDALLEVSRTLRVRGVADDLHVFPILNGSVGHGCGRTKRVVSTAIFGVRSNNMRLTAGCNSSVHEAGIEDTHVSCACTCVRTLVANVFEKSSVCH